MGTAKIEQLRKCSNSSFWGRGCCFIFFYFIAFQCDIQIKLNYFYVDLVATKNFRDFFKIYEV